jgi:hypothetical protein
VGKGLRHNQRVRGHTFWCQNEHAMVRSDWPCHDVPCFMLH